MILRTKNILRPLFSAKEALHTITQRIDLQQRLSLHAACKRLAHEVIWTISFI
jgi:hypothetical protein